MATACDRCRKIITEKDNSERERIDVDGHENRIDLCGSCGPEFWKWLFNSPASVLGSGEEREKG